MKLSEQADMVWGAGAFDLLKKTMAIKDSTTLQRWQSDSLSLAKTPSHSMYDETGPILSPVEVTTIHIPWQLFAVDKAALEAGNGGYLYYCEELDWLLVRTFDDRIAGGIVLWPGN